MKNVYDKINDLDFETDEFELNDIERVTFIKQKIMTKKKKYQQKNKDIGNKQKQRSSEIWSYE